MTSPNPSTTVGMIPVDVCVCTYRRPYLEETLRSLAALDLPSGVEIRVVVADNDEVPSAKALVATVAADLPFEICYVHCPASNISLARNACLEAARGRFLAFIDDDSTASQAWLAKLLDRAIATGADAVLGPIHAIYAESAPRWMQTGDFHSTGPVWVSGEIRTGYSGNVLLDRMSPHVGDRRFNLALGRTGGEDTEYFAQLHASGGKMAYEAEAVAYEPVPDNRARFSWLLKRRFRSGQTHGRLLAERHASLPQAGIAAAKLVYCLGAAVLQASVPHRRNRQLLRGVLHAGVVCSLFGLGEISLYGQDPAKEQTNAA